MNLIKSKVIDPSLSVGGGYTFFGEVATDINPGAGLTFWFTDNVGLELTTRYKNLLKEKKQNGTRCSITFNIQLSSSNLEVKIQMVTEY
jgi:outer membrane protein W